MGRVNPGLFSSERDDWTTPRPLFYELDAEFDFTLDPCASHTNALCTTYYTRADDGLAQPWAPHRVFMNPPYGREIAKWVAKADHECSLGAVVVCLVPARVETAWFHDHIYERHEVRFIRGRLSFNGGGKTSPQSHNAPFPSMVVVMRPSDAWSKRLATLREQRDAIAQAIRPHVYGLLDADDRARLAADAVLALLAEREGA